MFFDWLIDYFLHLWTKHPMFTVFTMLSVKLNY